MDCSELLLPIREELDEVHKAVAEAVKRSGGIDYSVLQKDNIIEYNIRPALVYAAAHLCGLDSASVVPVAKAVQFIFFATVVHDRAVKLEDIACDDLKALILLGDYLFSASFRVLAEAGMQQLLVPLSKVVCAECEAAVEPAKNGEIEPGVLKKESALLFGECCRLPGMLAGVDFVDRIYAYGISLGMVYGCLKRKVSSFQAAGYIKEAREALLKLPLAPARQQLKEALDLVTVSIAGLEAAATK
ncbi:MAG: hypothetical protein AB1500_09595 [Bacillota bacterium]